MVVRVHHKLHKRHLLLSTHSPKRVSIKGWTLKTFSSERLGDNLTTLSHGSTLRALQALSLLYHQMHRCLFIYLFLYFSRSRFIYFLHILCIQNHFLIYSHMMFVLLFISCVFSRVYDSIVLSFL